MPAWWRTRASTSRCSLARCTSSSVRSAGLSGSLEPRRQPRAQRPSRSPSNLRVACRADRMANSQLLLSFAAAASAALLSGVLTWAIRPLLMRIALAKPNARSSHRIPTPQGAGIAVMAATLLAAVTVIAFAGTAEMKMPVAVFGATLFIAAVGFADDVKSIPVVPRLLMQGLAVAVVVLAAPENLRIVPACPFWIERGLLVLAGLWFVNLVN